jgi:hypothetical protein
LALAATLLNWIKEVWPILLERVQCLLLGKDVKYRCPLGSGVGSAQRELPELSRMLGISR